ncbi:uncharacterized protein A4U43_C01F32610 [Asparagus officinalis]|uniref:Uncharacterized protein n=1 Tax=Asparagus officinalis TaxID=4686 RepID=A0A5P1FXE2_ASPOF|nr:uncharacterized protein A4U43_C01F32610 [Asparagus officinalis]
MLSPPVIDDTNLGSDVFFSKWATTASEPSFIGPKADDNIRHPDWPAFPPRSDLEAKTRPQVESDVA